MITAIHSMVKSHTRTTADSTAQSTIVMVFISMGLRFAHAEFLQKARASPSTNIHQRQ